MDCYEIDIYIYIYIYINSNSSGCDYISVRKCINATNKITRLYYLHIFAFSVPLICFSYYYMEHILSRKTERGIIKH